MHERRLGYFCRDSLPNLVLSEHCSAWGEFIHPNQLITEAALSIKEFTDANALERPPPTITGVLATKSWKTPPPVYKINWDVAIDSKNRCMDIGIIAWDCEGQVIAANCH
jgi:hypothetical protein